MIEYAVAFAVALAISTACGNGRESASSDSVTVQEPEAMRRQLEQLSAGSISKDSFELEYNDMHAFHGGETLAVRGDALTGRFLFRNDVSPEQLEPPATTMTAEQLLTLVELLLEIEAWEQRVPAREAVPDESAASLSIRVGPVESSIWEWYNDLSGNDRMVRVKQILEGISGPPRADETVRDEVHFKARSASTFPSGSLRQTVTA